MRNYKTVVDLIQRRLGTMLHDDGIAKVYVEMDENKNFEYTCVLRNSITAIQRTNMEIRYRHALIDYLEDVDISVLQPTQYFYQSKTCYAIYDEKEGFRI